MLIPCNPCRRRRKVYDQTGSVEDSEELAGEKFNELYEYYRGLFVKVGRPGLPALYKLHKALLSCGDSCQCASPSLRGARPLQHCRRKVWLR